MNSIKKYITGNNGNRTLKILVFLVPIFCILFMANAFAGEQKEAKKAHATEVDIKILSAEVLRFEKPYRLGVGKRQITYQEAMELKIQVDREQFDSLPPSIEPFLYIGKEEYRIFHIDRKDDRRELILKFHVRNWEKLADGVPVVLTIDHGAPVREIKKLMESDAPRFKKAMVVDKRK